MLSFCVQARQQREEAEARAKQIAEAKNLQTPSTAQMQAIKGRNAAYLERRSGLQHAKERQKSLEKKRAVRLHMQVCIAQEAVRLAAASTMIHVRSWTLYIEGDYDRC